ncbi:ParA family protein [Anoxybacillus sp. ST4]|uniref:ParA family protein n=1 Tax=Anoxybacillus sp. ST4 TaxID=2864181 RepID=UPI001C6449B2|nr:ParA family protein [Anoxybacillus sp. ST4]MBW7650861.1 ParA family protein [Anoxybacillus sp. ST4]
MTRYAFWNNKGGTGKTSLIFQTVLEHARRNPNSKILVIDLCPQANLSDLLFGGLLGNGAENLNILHQQTPRKSVGGYFQSRISTPYTVPEINIDDYISIPNEFNSAVPPNIELLAGDQLVEVQTNSIATLSNTSLPGINPWLAVIDWINDFIKITDDKYRDVFIDTNPSFSIYTQIALAAAERLVLPVMADDSSKRAIQNVFSLVHGIHIPTIYQESSFATRLKSVERTLPLIHLIVKNRLTQYMGPASAYQSIFTSIDNYIKELMISHPKVFTFTDYQRDGVVEVRDFQTTGVVAFAKGLPFRDTPTGKHEIFDRTPQVNQDFLNTCIDAINAIVDRL